MAEISKTSAEPVDRSRAIMASSDVNRWFVREVLPLEAALMQFLRRNWRNNSDIDDLCQDVYMRVYEAARKQIPYPAKPVVFTIARNLLVDLVRREHVVPIEAVADLDALGVAIDEPSPERSAITRDELLRLQAALDRLPQRRREAVVMRKIEGLSLLEIAARMGISENTVDRHLCEGMCALADMLFGEAPDLRMRS
jgi:RNA polymerase sigma-70 factor (ECF subfamily)